MNWAVRHTLTIYCANHLQKQTLVHIYSSYMIKQMKNIYYLNEIHILKGSYISIFLELLFFNFSLNNLKIGCKSPLIDKHSTSLLR